MSVEDYIEELKMFMRDSSYSKLHSLINAILSVKLQDDKVVNLYNEVVYIKDHMEEYEKKIGSLEGQVQSLKKENDELKKEVAELRKENDELKKEVAELRKENAELKKEVVELRKENADLRKEIAELKLEKLVNKLITAVQDLNASDQLEKHFSAPINQMFYGLRMSRNTLNHYLKLEGYVTDSNDVIQYKKYILYQVITSISEDAKEWFEDEYGEGLVNHTIEYLQTVIKEDHLISDKNKRMVKRWWGLL